MQKTKNRLKILIPIIAIAVLVIVGVVILKTTSLKRAINKMDIADKESVIHVLKFAKNMPDILCDIATEYINENNPLGAGMLMHLLQNIDCENERAKTLLKDYYTKIGADPIFINQVDRATYIDTDFEVVTEYNGTGYGGMDGIYCCDFDGYIRYKLSGARVKSMYATDTGVYFLDSADNCVKLLTSDGATAKNILENTSEFVFFDGKIFSIDNNSKINAPSPVILNEGEFGANLRIVGEQVLCDIFNENYQLTDTITLN